MPKLPLTVGQLDTLFVNRCQGKTKWRTGNTECAAQVEDAKIPASFLGHGDVCNDTCPDSDDRGSACRLAYHQLQLLEGSNGTYLEDPQEHEEPISRSWTES